MATADLHAALRPWNYLTDRPAPGKGLAALAPRIAELRAEAPNCLLFDNGDTFEGTPMAEAAARPDAGPDPMIEAMNSLGYDAATLGNHDFNFGLEALGRRLGGARFPVVLCNIRHRDGREFLPPSVVLERAATDDRGARHRLRIGVVGAAPPQLVDWDWALLRGTLAAAPIVPAAAAELARLRDEDGVDLTVVLCHSGIDPEAPEDGGENAVVPLAATGLADAIVAGHTHRLFPAPGAEGDGPDPDGLPAVVQPGCYGTHLGVIDLDLAAGPGGGWRVRGARAWTTPAGDRPPAPAILGGSEAAHDRIRQALARPIGATEGPLITYFDLMAPCAILRLVADAKRRAAAELLRGHPEAGLPLLAVVGPTRIGAGEGGGAHTDIPAGPLALRHVYDLYSFSNSLVVMSVSGAGLRAWLEHAARAFLRIEPGVAGQHLIDGRLPAYGFDVIDGLSYAIDVTAPRRDLAPEGPGRIRDLRHSGQPVRDGDRFLLATNSYRAGGGGGYAAVAGARLVLASGLPVREALVRHIEAEARLPATAPEIWRFAPAGGTPVLAQTAAGALDHSAIYEAQGLVPRGAADSGGVLFELTL